MTSLLSGTVAHGARGGRGVSTSHCCRIFPGLSGTPWYSPELPGSGSHNKKQLTFDLFTSRTFSQNDRCIFYHALGSFITLHRVVSS